MLADSIIGKLYLIWLQSGLFGFARRLYRPFKLAWSGSLTRRILTRRGHLAELWPDCFACRCIDSACSVMLSLLRRILPRGLASSVLTFETFTGIVLCCIFICPHQYWNNYFGLAAAVLLLICRLYLVATGRREPFKLTSLGLPFALFALSCVFGVARSSQTGDSLRALAFFVTAFIFMYVIAADAGDSDKLRRILAFIYFALIAVSAYAVVQRFIGVPVNTSYTDMRINIGVPGRVYSTLENPNNLGEFVVLFTPLCAVFAATSKKPLSRLILCLALALPLVALIMTYSRSAWLSFILACAVFVFFADKRLIPLAAVLCLAAIPLLPDSILVRISTLFGGRDASINYRGSLWAGVINLLGDNFRWLTGVGLGDGAFLELYPQYAYSTASSGVVHTQMIYLELLVQTGLLGFMSYLWMMFRSVRDSITAASRRRSTSSAPLLMACAGSFIGMAVSGIAEYYWFYPRNLFAYFILFGIMLAALKVNGNESRDIQ